MMRGIDPAVDAFCAEPHQQAPWERQVLTWHQQEACSFHILRGMAERADGLPPRLASLRAFWDAMRWFYTEDMTPMRVAFLFYTQGPRLHFAVYPVEPLRDTQVGRMQTALQLVCKRLQRFLYERLPRVSCEVPQMRARVESVAAEFFASGELHWCPTLEFRPMFAWKPLGGVAH